MKKEGWLLYESDSAEVNKWFIEKLQAECEPFGLSLKLVYTDYVSDAYDMNLSGLADELLKSSESPSFVVNRSRNAEIAYSFEKHGIRVFNPAKVTEVANDKESSYRIADMLGIPYMPYVTVGEKEILSLIPDMGRAADPDPDTDPLSDRDPYSILESFSVLCGGIRSVSDTDGYRSIRQKAADFGYPFVLKPAEGHGGQHVSLVTDEAQLLASLQSIIVDYRKHPYRKLLLQRLADVRGRDLRVYFINGEIVTGMLRTAKNAGDLCANFSLGGNAEMHTLNREERFIACELAEALPGDYMGVDFVFDKNGAPVFNEFEDVVGARMIYANTDIDMIRLFARHIGSCVS